MNDNHLIHIGHDPISQFIDSIFSDGEDFDVLFRDFHSRPPIFNYIRDIKTKYPMNVYKTEDDKEIVFEIAAIGLDKEDIDIKLIKGKHLLVTYKKEEAADDEEEKNDYVFKKLAKRNFGFEYIFDSTYDIDKINPKLEKGCLTITVPKKEKVIKEIEGIKIEIG